MNNLIHRRTFCKVSSTFVAGISAAGKTLVTETQKDTKKRLICVFSKCLQFLNYDLLGEVIANIGFDGADLTVRQGGHVSPENVKQDLPRAFKSLQRANVKIPMIVTSIVDPDDKYTQQILGTASDLGIKYYRMGSLGYDANKTIPQNIDSIKSKLEKFEKVNRKFGIHGGYQNHSGRGFGGPVWDLYYALKDMDPEYIGVQYDIRHATVEGANSWIIGLKLAAPWIRTSAIKDFVWEKDESGTYVIKNVVLGNGMVNLDEYISQVAKLNIEGPFTIHYEYDLGGAEHGNREISIDKKIIFDLIGKDLRYLKGMFERCL